VTIEWVIPGRLARSSRPGFGGPNPTEVDPSEVEAWLDEARRLGIRSILCLLDDRQLAFYSRLSGGLLGAYRRAGMVVDHPPVPDLQTPPIPEGDLPRVGRAFRDLPAPLLVHCSAGVDRTGAAVAYLVDRLASDDSSRGDVA
jgi:hypothetical protein